MSIRDWDIGGEPEWFGDELSRLGFRLREPGFGRGDSGWVPQVDIHEREDAVILVLDLPGVRREDIELHLDPGGLTLQGKRGRLTGARDLRLERPCGPFRRSFRIEVPIEPAEAQARYRDGVLEITLPKSPASGPTRVRVVVE
jgi:HSP20 family protein